MEQSGRQLDNGLILATEPTRTEVVDVRRDDPTPDPNMAAAEVATAMSSPGKRPWKGAALTLNEAAAQCTVSLSTIRRRHAEGAFPHAYQDSKQRWRIPVTDLQAAGLKPGKPAQPDKSPERALTDRTGIIEIPRLDLEALQRDLADAKLQVARLEGERSQHELVVAAKQETMNVLQAMMSEYQRAIAAAAPTEGFPLAHVNESVEQPKRRFFRRKPQP